MTLIAWIAIGMAVVALMLIRRRMRAAQRRDLGSISERWLTEQRTGRDR